MSPAKKKGFRKSLVEERPNAKSSNQPEVALTPTELAALAQQFGSALAKGEPVLATLESLAAASDKPAVAEAIRAIAVAIRSGDPPNEAFARYPDVFTQEFADIWRGGEVAGSVDVAMLEFAAKYGDKPQSEQNPPVGHEELAMFSHQLAELLEQHYPILVALETLANQQENTMLADAVMNVRADIRAGTRFSKALAKHPSIFPSHFVEMARAGENNSTLPQVLKQSAVSLRTEYFHSTPEGAEIVATPEEKELLTFDQAVQFLGTSKPTLYRLLGQDRIKGLRVGRQWRFRKSDLVAYMEEKPPAVPASAAAEIDAELAFFRERMGSDRPDTMEAEGDEGAKIVALVNAILTIALDAGASDLHIDPQRAGVLIRMRIDGVLHEIRIMSLRLLEPLVGRLKVMGDMDVTERRQPQDGRIHLKWRDKDFDLRVSSLPSSYGESVAMRFLVKPEFLVGLDRLHLSHEEALQLKGWLACPSGLILITGPTGSGKTTTLYACISSIEEPETKKLVSVEDPVEYNLPYVTQTFVNAKSGLTFPAVIRALLRSDPDVIIIGETRDQETAQGALQAALTGHLILSSMHTLGTVNTVQRLTDLGAEPFLVSSSLLGVLHQRLVRRICDDCREEVDLAPALLTRARELAEAGGYRIPSGATFHRGAGCAKCRQSGYKRRVPIYELLEVNSTIAEAIARHADPAELLALAIEQGMITVTAAGIRKAVEGSTTVEEVLRVALPF